MAILLLCFATHTSVALEPFDEALDSNTDDCSDGIGLSFSNKEFDDALALGGQDESEFKLSRYACGSYDSDGRYENVQCTEPLAFESFPSAGIEPEGWVVCIVTMLIDDNGRGFRASLDDYEAILPNGQVVSPNPLVSSWAGSDDGIFNLDLSTEQIYSAGGLGKGLLAFADMPNDDFLLRNRETGNQFLVLVRENAISALIPIVAAPEVGPIVFTGTNHSSSPWILSLGYPLRVTLEVEGVGNLVALEAKYRVTPESILSETQSLISAETSFSDPEYFGPCPPCSYSHTIDFRPDADDVLSFSVLTDGRWTITVEAVGSDAPVRDLLPPSSDAKP